MLQFGLAAALEVLHAAIGGEACRVPESDGVLHTELVLKGADDHLLASARCCYGVWSGVAQALLKLFDMLLGIKKLYP